MRSSNVKALAWGTGDWDLALRSSIPRLLSLLLIAVSVFVASSCAYDPHTHELDEMEVSLVTEPDPPKVGENVVRAKITDKKGAPLADEHVTEFAYFRFEGGKQQGFLKASPAEAHGGNEYVGTVNFSEPGQWKVVLALERGGSRIDPVTFTFEVK